MTMSNRDKMMTGMSSGWNICLLVSLFFRKVPEVCRPVD